MLNSMKEHTNVLNKWKYVHIGHFLSSRPEFRRVILWSLISSCPKMHNYDLVSIYCSTLPLHLQDKDGMKIMHSCWCISRRVCRHMSGLHCSCQCFFHRISRGFTNVLNFHDFKLFKMFVYHLDKKEYLYEVFIFL